MNAKKKNILIGAVIGVAIFLILVGILAASGVFHKFNASGYVEAILDQTLKGEVKGVAELTDGTTDVLYEQYEAGITSFVENSILNGVQVDDELKGKYVEVGKKVFAGMKYEVQEATELEDGGFEVKVKYQVSDVFDKYVVAVEGERQRLYEKADNGEYRGVTLEEVNAQIQEEFLKNACTLLEECYKNMEFGGEETMTFTVKKDESGLYKMQEGQITEFIKKIMNLDAKED